MDHQEEKVYLKRVRIKGGERNIKDVDVSFLPGLNIIIGYNGVGKTSFLEYLDTCLNMKVPESEDFSARLDIADYQIHIKSSVSSRNEANNNSIGYSQKNKSIYLVDGEGSKHEESEEILDRTIFKLKYFDRVYIKHGIPNVHIKGLDSPATINLFASLNGIKVPEAMPKFYAYIFQKIDNHVAELKNQYEDHQLIEEIKQIIPMVFGDIKMLSDSMKKVTHIHRVAISNTETILFPPEKFRRTEGISINDFYTSFYSEHKHFGYQQLSDGNKRVFLILSNILYPSASIESSFGKTTITETQIDDSLPCLVLLEEPELGIHPHQLHRLMTLIKEVSEEKQIILTTHSPEVLNILGPDELDRIILAEYVDEEQGTQFRHLTEQEQEKARRYMAETGWLSDYWMHSDLQIWKDGE